VQARAEELSQNLAARRIRGIDCETLSVVTILPILLMRPVAEADNNEGLVRAPISLANSAAHLRGGEDARANVGVDGRDMKQGKLMAADELRSLAERHGRLADRGPAAAWLRHIVRLALLAIVAANVGAAKADPPSVSPAAPPTESSQAGVIGTIEFDNETKPRIPPRSLEKIPPAPRIIEGPSPMRAVSSGLKEAQHFQELPTLPEPMKPSKAPPEKAGTLPMPRPGGAAANAARLERLTPNATGFGRTPQPTAKDLLEMNKYIEKFIDPRNVVDLVRGRIRLLVMKEAPKRVQIGDSTIAEYAFVGGKALEISLSGRAVGSTVLNLWFDDPAQKDKEKVLSILVRVIPDPEERERLEGVYKALEKEINQHFPDSVVHLKLLGDKLAVSGQAHDGVEANQILRIVRANAPGDNSGQGGGPGNGSRGASGGKPAAAQIPLGPESMPRPDDPGVDDENPGLEDYLLSGGPNVINMMKIPGEQQVMLKVTVAEVNRAAARSIGVNFSITNNQGLTVFQNTTGAIGGMALAAAGIPNPINNLPVALDNGQIVLAINALRTLNYARSLAEPNLVTLNGKTALFQAGGEFPIPVVTGNTFNGLQGVNFVPFGVRLRFTPFITDKDRIRLNLQGSVSTRDAAIGTNIGNSSVSGLNSRRFSTIVEMREGQTLAIAGLIQNNLGTDSTRVPFFGDMPIIGRLASFDRTTHAEQELIVLVTPQLVHPMGAKEVPPLPGADLFEPNDIEFYLLGRLESHQGRDYRSPVMTDWSRLRRNNRIESSHIFGASGYVIEP
jgi:pilus assembly protein CpaC